MKKLTLIAAIILGSSVAFAQFTGSTVTNSNNAGGGYTGARNITSASQIQSLRDDSHVILEGKITTHLGGDRYLFQDATGEIEIEIDHDDWRGVSASPKDTVILYGEVDHNTFKASKIDVDRISIK